MPPPVQRKVVADFSVLGAAPIATGQNVITVGDSVKFDFVGFLMDPVLGTEIAMGLALFPGTYKAGGSFPDVYLYISRDPNDGAPPGGIRWTLTEAGGTIQTIVDLPAALFVQFTNNLQGIP